MTDWKYDKVLEFRIGYTDVTEHTTYMPIYNVISWADRAVAPDGRHVSPLNIINAANPPDIHQHHKLWEMELMLDSDSNAFVNQRVQNADANSRAIRWDQDNNFIEYLYVLVREADGGNIELTYTDLGVNQYGAQEMVWCTGSTHDYTNERNARHQPSTYKFVCLQERERTEL